MTDGHHSDFAKLRTQLPPRMCTAAQNRRRGRRCLDGAVHRVQCTCDDAARISPETLDLATVCSAAGKSWSTYRCGRLDCVRVEAPVSQHKHLRSRLYIHAGKGLPVVEGGCDVVTARVRSRTCTQAAGDVALTDVLDSCTAGGSTVHKRTSDRIYASGHTLRTWWMADRH